MPIFEDLPEWERLLDLAALDQATYKELVKPWND
jgi:hypothetical protein